MVNSPYLAQLTRIEPLYWGLRGLIGLGLALHFVWGPTTQNHWDNQWIVLVVYAVSLLIPMLLLRLSSLPFNTIFWPSFCFDILIIGAVIHWTGGAAENLSILYYVLAAFVGYHMGLTTAVAVAAAMTLVFAIPMFANKGMAALADVVFGGTVLLAFSSAMSLAASSVKQSTERLLNAMDRLNERTTELEQTHSQLETIYETSRSLAELLAEDNVIDRVLHIGRSVLNYPVCEIYTWDRTSRMLHLKGRVDEHATQRLDRPQVVVPSDVFRQALTQGKAVRVIDRHLGRTVVDGNPYRSLLVVPMVSEGKIRGLLCVQSKKANAFSDRDERVLSILASSAALALVNADLHRQMEKMTIEDELTGTYNFRFFRSRLADEKRRTVRYGQPLSLIMVDIDWFKKLNDEHGHQIGNVALRQLATVIGACIRDVDMLARYGGEEFIIILPQTATEEATVIGERIRQKVEVTEFGPDAEGHPLRLTVSIGISCYPDNGASEDRLVESVDQALYRAKGDGKNLVRLYHA